MENKIPDQKCVLGSCVSIIGAHLIFQDPSLASKATLCACKSKPWTLDPGLPYSHLVFPYTILYTLSKIFAEFSVS